MRLAHRAALGIALVMVVVVLLVFLLIHGHPDGLVHHGFVVQAVCHEVGQSYVGVNYSGVIVIYKTNDYTMCLDFLFNMHHGVTIKDSSWTTDGIAWYRWDS